MQKEDCENCGCSTKIEYLEISDRENRGDIKKLLKGQNRIFGALIILPFVLAMINYITTHHVPSKYQNSPPSVYAAEQEVQNENKE